MKMKTGPRVLLLAILFAGLGFWAGRGFPRTWEAFMQSNRVPVATQPDAGGIETDGMGGSVTSRRVTELEDRVERLEAAVSALRDGPIPASPEMPAPADPPATSPSFPPMDPQGRL